MKALLISTMAAMFGACVAGVVSKEEDLSKQIHIQDDYGNLNVGYNLDQTKGVLHSRHPAKGVLDQAYSNGRLQYGATIIKDTHHPTDKFLPLHVSEVKKADGEYNWLVSSSHRVSQGDPAYNHGKYKHPETLLGSPPYVY